VSAGAIGGTLGHALARAGIALEAFDAYEPYAFAPFASARVRERSLDRLVAWLATMPKDRSGVFRDIAVRRRPVETPSRPSELDVAGPIGLSLGMYSGWCHIHRHGVRWL